jgi:DNA-binding transcriptional LysR family regulator
MELRHLRYFVTVADEENISRASARLRISQPAVSRQIKDLEDELGTPLFMRAKTGMHLTRAGTAFLAHARDLLRRANSAVEELQQFSKPAKAELVIGVITPVLTGTLTPALRCFHQRHPKVELRITEKSPGEQVKALRAGELDAALVGQACAALGNEFEIVPLRRLPLAAVLPDDHLLALRKRIRLAELANESFIGLDDEAYPVRSESVCAICQAAGFTPQFRSRADSVAVLLAQVAAGKGVALLPVEAGSMPHPQTRFIPLAKPAPEVVSSALLRHGHNISALADLLECCREVR